jgi:CDP-glycerol glycerophosphotransferase
MQELLSTVDIVISDYSSLMFDFALSFKPCFQFATDIEEYKKDRDFYFDLNSLPFSLAISNDELYKNIISFDNTSYARKLKDFYEKVGMNLSGNASIKTAEIINEITK